MFVKRSLAMILACGGVVGVAAAQPEQPKVINISGATLLENFFNKRGGTIDYIDVDGDRFARSVPYPSGDPRRNDQLAPFLLPDADTEGAWPAEPGTGRNVHWAVMYSNVGSTNGFQELINFGRTYTSVPGSNPDSLISLRASVRSRAYVNRYRFLQNGAANDDNSPEFPGSYGLIANTGNPMNAPIMNTRDGNFLALFTLPNTPSTNAANGGSMAITSMGGLTIDIAPLDVPTTYATTQTGTPALTRNPLEPGYGNNPRLAINRDGTTTTTGPQGNTLGGQKLAQLTAGANLSATLPGVYNPAADSNTIFDTSIAFAPVAPVINFGTNIQRLDMSDLQHLFSTGRRKSGENLVTVTRDSGSGTRNAFDNSMGRDPSWGVGDNLGPRNNATANEQAGALYLPSNKNSNANVEPCTWNCRVAIGYVGPERGLDSSASTWLSSGLMEIAGVRNDIAPYNGTAFRRPTIDAILQYDAEGWVIGGPAVLASFGDPFSAPPEKGGLGWMEPFFDANNNGVYDPGEDFNDINNNGIRDAVEPRPALLNPPMRNVNAAAYLNNIARSLRAFEGSPGSDQTLFTPGELLATAFVLIDAMPRIQRVADPLFLDANPNYNPSLAAFTATPGINVYSNSAFAAFGNSVAPVNPSNSRAGKVPDRVAASTYSDQAVNSQAAVDGSYVTEGGATLARRTNLPLRNLTAGDFNGDGHRNAADIAEMVKAWRKRAQGQSWAAPGAIAGSYLAQEAARTGQAVNAADFCIEIQGDFDANGSFDLLDLRNFADGFALYNYTFTYNNVTGDFSYSGTLNRKQGFIDLDNAYVAAGGTLPLLPTMLATGKPYAAGDARADLVGPGRNPTAPTPLEQFRVARGALPIGFDGVIDANDIDYVYRNFKQPGITGSADWADLNEAALFDLSADITGDLKVDQDDVIELVTVILGTTMGDVNLDGVTDCTDRSIAAGNLGMPGGWAMGDVDGDGVVTAADVQIIAQIVCPADWNGDCVRDVSDIFSFLTAWFANDPQAVNFGGTPGVSAIFAFLTVWFAGC
ncbi:MAG: dockerin type I repeat-containing protein [Phycisphaeraceae bacterium]|nr:dockerin type I repeat-containing protein [Phycisphaeraceae bacterium]